MSRLTLRYLMTAYQPSTAGDELFRSAAGPIGAGERASQGRGSVGAR